MKLSFLLLTLTLGGCISQPSTVKQSLTVQPPLPPVALASMPSTSLAAGMPEPVNHLLTWTVGPSSNSPCFVKVEGSQDLTNWVGVASFPDTNGDYTFTDTNGLPQRFYRVMAVGSWQVVTNLGVQ